MKCIEKLGADRLRVLKALVEGGCVEKRRIYPYPETYHLRRFEITESPPKVSDVCMTDLIAKHLIAPSQPVDFTHPESTDTIDYVATPAAHRAVQLKGIEYEDTQEELLGSDAGKYDTHPLTSMEAA